MDPPGSPREGQDQGRHQVAAVWEDGPGGGASQGQRRRLSLGVLMGEGGCGLDITSLGAVKTSFRFRWDKIHRHVMLGVIAVESLTASLPAVAEKWRVAERLVSPSAPESRLRESVLFHTPGTQDVAAVKEFVRHGMSQFRRLVADLTVLGRRTA